MRDDVGAPVAAANHLKTGTPKDALRAWRDGWQRVAALTPNRPKRINKTTARLRDRWTDGGRNMTQPLEHLSSDEPDEFGKGQKRRLVLVNLAGGAP